MKSCFLRHLIVLSLILFCFMMRYSHAANQEMITRDDTIAQYRQLIQNWPEAAQQTFSILLELMEKNKLPALYPDGEYTPAVNKRMLRLLTYRMGVIMHGDKPIELDPTANQFHLGGDEDNVIDDSFGDDIADTGMGNDIIKIGWGRDIVIFRQNWGHDKVLKTCPNAKFRADFYKDPRIQAEWVAGGYQKINFIVFGLGVFPEDMQWDLFGKLTNKKSGDSVELQPECFDIVFYEDGNLQNFEDYRQQEASKYKEMVTAHQLQKKAMGEKQPQKIVQNNPPSVPDATEQRRIEFFEKCQSRPDSACVYNVLINGLQDLGIGIINFHHTQKRMDLIDRTLQDLLEIGAFDIAEHWALREMAQRDVFTFVTPQSSIYEIYKQAVSREQRQYSAASKPKTDAKMPFRQEVPHLTQKKRSNKLTAEFYQYVEDGKLSSAEKSLENFVLKDQKERGFFIGPADQYAYFGKASTYVEMLAAMVRAYIKENRFERARHYIRKLDDKGMMYKLFGWERSIPLKSNPDKEVSAYKRVTNSWQPQWDAQEAYETALREMSGKYLFEGDSLKAAQLQARLARHKKTGKPPKYGMDVDVYYGSPLPTYILPRAAVYAAQKNEPETVALLLNKLKEARVETVKKVSEGYLARLKQDNQDLAIVGQEKALVQLRWNYENASVDVRTYLDIALAFATHDKRSGKFLEFYDLHKKSVLEADQFYTRLAGLGKAHRLKQDRTALTLAKSAIAEAIFSESKAASPEVYQEILLPLRVPQNGAGFISQFGVAYQISRLYYDHGFQTYATEMLEIARLLAEHINAGAASDRNRQVEAAAAYQVLAEEYVARGQEENIEDAYGKLSGLQNPVTAKGTDQSVYLVRERLLVDLALKLRNEGKEEAVTVAEELTHPLYRKLVMQLYRRDMDRLSFEEIVRHVWNEEDMVETIPYLLQMSTFLHDQNRGSEVSELLRYAEIIGDAFVSGYRNAQVFIMLSDFYRSVGDMSQARRVLRKGGDYLLSRPSYAEELQAQITERYAVLGDTEGAMKVLRREVSNMFNLRRGGYHLSNGARDYERLIPLAHSMAKLDGKIFETDMMKQLLADFGKKPLLPLWLHHYNKPDPSCGLADLPENAQVHVVLTNRSLEKIVNQSPEPPVMILERIKVKVQKSKEPIVLILMSGRKLQWQLDIEEGTNIAGVIVADAHTFGVIGLEQASFPVIYTGGEFVRKCSTQITAINQPMRTGRGILVLNKYIRDLTGKDIDHISLKPVDEKYFEVTALADEEKLIKEKYKEFSRHEHKKVSAHDRALQIVSILEKQIAGNGQEYIRQYTVEDADLALNWLAGANAKFKRFNNAYDLLNPVGSEQSLPGYAFHLFKEGYRKSAFLEKHKVYVIEGPAYVEEPGFYFVKAGVPRPVHGKSAYFFYLDDYSCEAKGQDTYCQRYQDGLQ